MNVNLSTITTPLRALWDELVERRLWPVAIVLVVALVAVPVLLLKPAKTASPPSPAPAGAGTSSPSVAFQPAVSTEGKKSSEIQKDLRSFKRKNPFTPQGLTSGGAAGAAASGTATPTASGTAGQTVSSGSLTGGGSSSNGSSTGSSTGSSGTGTSFPTGSTGAQTKKTIYWHYTVDVRFGKTGKEDLKTLNEFRALPGSDNPVLVFMGVKSDGKTAVFLVSAKATTIGDGKCAPSDTECTFLYMKKGDKQTIEAIDTTGAITDYTLELKSVDVKQTSAPAKAKSSKSRRAALRRESRARLFRVENTFRTLGL
jgi:hypothetical protein